MIIGVPMAIMYALAVGVSVAASKGGGALAALIWLTFFAAVIVLSIASALLQWPMKIHAGLRQTFDPAGMINFSKDFIRLMWKETVLSMLFLMAWGLLLWPVGVLTCCLGFFLIGPYLMLAQHHLEQQAYRLHLERGGVAVPEKPSTTLGDDATAADASGLSPPPMRPPGSPPAPPDAFREKP